MSEIKAAELGDSDSLVVGEQVVAIGNALGYGQSVTTGIVSALLNMNGEVVGINSAKYSSTEVEGMGYAISITTALPIIQDLMNRTTREKVSEAEASYLGINGEDVTSTIEDAYGIPQGIYVTMVAENSPAAEAGIQTTNVITHFDGIRVTSMSNLEKRLEYYAAGETVEVTLQVQGADGYEEQTVSVTLGNASENSNATQNPFQQTPGYGDEGV